MTRVGALWIGGLEAYMDENFLRQAMAQLGQEGIVSIKVMSNKFTGEPAGYGFINFDSDQRAVLTMHKLGGKVIPNSNPPVRFKLNHNSTRLQPGETDTSIWVGDLTQEVDDFALYQFFTQRYQSVRCAKVVLDDQGMSKGYGFVRFASEADQQHALTHMSGEPGLGGKLLKVSLANQKNRSGPGSAIGIPAHMGVGHQNGGAASWGAPLDMQIGGGPGANGSVAEQAGWPGMQSPHWQTTAAVAAAVQPGAIGGPYQFFPFAQFATWNPGYQQTPQ